MSKFYSDSHRALQDRFDTRRLADMMENAIAHPAFAEHEIAFIESRAMFFLSTLDPSGRPTVSYKGGAPGFVKVTGPSELAFPFYNGNGMYYSAGNLAQQPEVGLLFIDFEKPNRLRAQGKATLLSDDPLMEKFAGAELLVRVAVETIWVNCPRYIHPHGKNELSKYVPRSGEEPPMPAWKRIDIVQDALPAIDKAKVAGAGGEISQEAYAEMIAKGEG